MKIQPMIAVYSILVGLLVIGMWTVILTTGEIPEGRIALGFHLYAEFAMAVICLVSGFMLLGRRKFSRMTNMGGLGMVVYSTVNAAGYYGQKGEIKVMILFMVLAFLTILAICGHYVVRKNSQG